MELEPIPYSTPWLTAREAEATAAVIASGRLILGPEVRAFERSLADFCGRERAVAVTSGTSALQLALQAHGVGPGWHVIVPAYTWVATWSVAHWLGATPILADIDPDTFCLSERSVQDALRACSDATRRAILPVHLFGARVDPGWLEPLVAREQLRVVGDGCCAFGGKHLEKRCGGWTPTECLSFHPRKVITTGEGGAILTDDHTLADRLERLRDHGAHRTPEQREQTRSGGEQTPDFPEPGHNMRMTEMQGAVGRVQMERVKEIIAGRVRVAARYDRLLPQAAPWLRLPHGADDPGRVLTCYAVQLRGEDHDLQNFSERRMMRLSAWRSRLLGALAEQAIAARPPMISLLDVPFTQPSRVLPDYSGAALVSALTFGLPFSSVMRDDQVDRVVEALAACGPATRGSDDD